MATPGQDQERGGDKLLTDVEGDNSPLALKMVHLEELET